MLVKFKTKVDRNGRIYLAKSLRESGLVNTIEIRPNTEAAVIYQTGTRLEDVLESIRIITMDIEHQLKIQREAEQK